MAASHRAYGCGGEADGRETLSELDEETQRRIEDKLKRWRAMGAGSPIPEPPLDKRFGGVDAYTNLAATGACPKCGSMATRVDAGSKTGKCAGCNVTLFLLGDELMAVRRYPDRRGPNCELWRTGEHWTCEVCQSGRKGPLTCGEPAKRLKTKQKRCGKCGEAIPAVEGVRFCVRCGTEIQC